ncbi:MAG TPA: phosphatase PAP2 family protein, partial [Chloroflexota bacterium]
MTTQPEAKSKGGRRDMQRFLAIALLGAALSVLTVVVPSTTLVRADPSGSTSVLDWNTTAIQLVSAAQQNPIAALRTMAMVHVAIYDAVQAISTAPSRGFTGYTVDGARLYGVDPQSSLESASAAAARTVLLGLFPDKRSDIDAAYATSIAHVPDTATRQEGILIGDWVAVQILRWRSSDHSNRPDDYNQPVRPGIFQPPGKSAAVFVYLAGVTPFALQSSAQFRPEPPPALTSDQYTADYNEVKSLGGANSSTRTADETQAALFWFDNDFYMWNTAARVIAAQKQTTLMGDARLFAELNVAMYDAMIAVFDAKYTYNFWRPEAAIHNGNSDGNPATIGDPTWTPLRPTAPHPDYPSAHTANGGAASTVLASFFGTDAIRFSFTTRTSPGGAVRSYTSLSQAAEEEGLSRIWLGYHFRTAVNVGLTMGQEVGAW